MAIAARTAQAMSKLRSDKLRVMVATAILTAIAAQAIAAHMRFLAGDLLEGREPGTRGFDVAAAYVAAQFESIGLQTSYQPIAFRSAELIEKQSSFAIDGHPLTI